MNPCRRRAPVEFVLAIALAAFAARGAVAGPAGVLKPLSPAWSGHAMWDADRHQFWVMEPGTPGVWSYDPAAAAHWKWHGIGSFNQSSGLYSSGHRVFFDRARDELVLPWWDRLFRMPIRDNLTWDTVIPMGSPPNFGPLVLDEVGDRLIVEGELGALAQLTLSDPPTWSDLAVANTIPGHAGDAPMVFDPVHGLLVMAGGTYFEPACDTYLPSHKAWKLSLSDLVWSPLPDVPGTGGGEVQLLWDAAHARVIAAGGHYYFECAAGGLPYEGYSSQVHALDPAAALPAWEPLAPLPGGRATTSLAINPDTDELVAFGGFAPSPLWTVLPGNHFDAQVMPMSGPLSGVWREQASDAPWSAFESDVVFDPMRGDLLLHGGTRAFSSYGDYGTIGELMRFDDADTLWSSVGEAHAAARTAAVVDPEHDVAVYFGGYFQSPIPLSPAVTLATTTVVSLQTGAVSQPVTGSAPPARSGAVMAWDAPRHRVLLYGGRGENNVPLTDLWALDPATWTWSALATTGPPPTGDPMSAVFDAPGNRTLLLTGRTQGPRLYALLPTAGAETWVVLPSLGPLPDLQSITIDTARHRLLGVESSLGVFEAVLGPGPLSWALLQTSNASAFDASVFYDAMEDRMLIGLRSDPYGHGKARVLALEFGGGALSVPGAPHPGAPALRLVGARPSPRGPEVEFSLSGQGPARLELFDVSGRRVWSREVGALGAGSHRVRAGGEAWLPAGVYAVRLVSAGQEQRARAVIVH